MKNALITLTAFAALLSSGLAQDEVATDAKTEAKWFADYDKAAAHAQETGKDLLVDFTGSDWCGWCIKLHKEVFDHESFSGPASEKFVFVALDFPNAEEIKAKVPNPERNQELSKLHNVRGFPTILLMTNDGTVYARTGYEAGGPENYLAHLNGFYAKDRKAVLESKAFAAKLMGSDEVSPELAVEALTKFEASASSATAAAILAPAITKLVNDGKLTADGQEKKAVIALVKSGHSTPAMDTKAKAFDPKNEEGVIEALVLAKFKSVSDDVSAKAALDALDGMKDLTFKDQDARLRLHMNGMSWCGSPRLLNDMPRAKRYAKVVLELATEEAMKAAAQKILDSE